MRVEIDTAGLTQMFSEMENNLDREVENGLQELAEFAQKHASETNLFKTSGQGGLRDSIKIIKSGDRVREVLADKPYAHYVEYGRGPVEAKNAKALRFRINGELVFAKRVGPADPKPFMQQARDAAEAEAPIIFDRIAAKIRR